MSRVRTRFAPSPTGELHAGNVRIAVLNWLVARHHGGDFILRIEDTDTERNVADAESGLFEDLRWLGLDWDEGPDAQGAHGPYRQSERLDLYRRRAEALMAAGDAYRCFCSPETLQAAREAAREAGRSPRYPGTCRALDADEAARRAGAGEAHALRLRTPDHGDIVVHDRIRGAVTFDAADIGDFVIRRSDGLPTYNFAVVVDDAAMQVSHVIRGAGHLSNTPHQLLVYRALGESAPEFAHAPTVLAPEGGKLSKRAGARPLRELREEGLHPDGVLNYLSLLGWSSPSEEEFLTRDRLIAEVTLDRVNAGDVTFDPTKMRWLSGQHIAAMTLDELVEATRPFVEDSPFAGLLDGPFGLALDAVRSHLTAFGEVTDHLAPFLGVDPDASEPLSADDVAVIEAARAALAGLETWEPDAIQGAIKAAGKAVGARGRELYVPVRKALTGDEHGPPLGAVIAVQGRGRVLPQLAAILARTEGV